MREIDALGIKWASEYNKYDKVYNWICFLSQNLVANKVNINSENLFKKPKKFTCFY